MAVLRLRRLLEGSTVFAVALLIVGALCVPMWISCVALELDSPMSVEQVARISRAGLFVLLSCLVIQTLAGSILRSRFFPTSTGWRKLLQFGCMTAACAIASIGIGVLIDGLAEDRWRRIALTLFG